MMKILAIIRVLRIIIIVGDQSGGTPEEKRFDASRWGSASDGHLYDFAKRFLFVFVSTEVIEY